MIGIYQRRSFFGKRLVLTWKYFALFSASPILSFFCCIIPVDDIFASCLGLKVFCDLTDGIMLNLFCASRDSLAAVRLFFLYCRVLFSVLLCLGICVIGTGILLDADGNCDSNFYSLNNSGPILVVINGLVQNSISLK